MKNVIKINKEIICQKETPGERYQKIKFIIEGIEGSSDAVRI